MMPTLPEDTPKPKSREPAVKMPQPQYDSEPALWLLSKYPTYDELRDIYNRGHTLYNVDEGMVIGQQVVGEANREEVFLRLLELSRGCVAIYGLFNPVLISMVLRYTTLDILHACKRQVPSATEKPEYELFYYLFKNDDLQYKRLEYIPD